MFRCQICSCVAPPRIAPAHLVLEKRARLYPARARANLLVRNHKREHTNDPGGQGEEIVREVLVCPECARRHGAT
jgi:hypothetical protein